jgi:hypothetical protein
MCNQRLRNRSTPPNGVAKPRRPGARGDYKPSEREVEMVNRAFAPPAAGNKTGNKLSESQKTSEEEIPGNRTV